VSAFEKAAPLNPIYDDIARLRIVRAHLREVASALKAGNITKARKSFEAFEVHGSTSKTSSEGAHSMLMS
jgi:hypothetical protein